MDGADEDSGPPQPIVIPWSGITESTSEESAVKAADSQVLQQGMAKVQFFSDNKPDNTGLNITTFVLMLGVPFGIVAVLGIDDVLFEDITLVCCFSFALGAVFALVSSSRYTSWTKSVQDAKIDVIRAANLPVPEQRLKTYLNVGGFLLVLGIFIGPLGFIPGLILYAIGASGASSYKADINQAFHRLQTGHQDTLNRKK